MNKREKDKKKKRLTNASGWAKEQDKGFVSTSVQLPDGVEAYKLETGVHLVDVMPYRVGKGNPRADEGMVHFEREFIVHRIPAPGKSMPDSYCCAWQCFEKKCGVCDWMNANGKTADEELIKSLRGQTRHLFLFNDKPGDPDNAVKVFNTYHYNKGQGFGEILADAITSVERYGDFAELEGGMTLQLTVKEQTMGQSRKFNAVTRIDFVPRDYDYEEDVLDRMPCLDEMLVETPYKTLKSLLEQGGSEEEEQEEKLHVPVNRIAASRNGSSPKKNDPDPDDDDEEEDDSPTPPKKTFKVGDKVYCERAEGACKILKIVSPMKVTIEDEDDEEYTVSMNQLSATPIASDDDDDTSTPPKGKKSPAKKVVDDDDDDSDSTEEEDEEEEKPKRGRPAAKKPAKDDDDDESDDDSEEEDDPLEDDDSDDDDLDSEIEEEEDEEKPAPKKKTRK